MKKLAPMDLLVYAAFLRGINVGGRIIKMVDLKKALAAAGLNDIQTIGASGNVRFSMPKSDPPALEKLIEQRLEEAFGCAIAVMVRSIDQVRSLVESNPFKRVTVSPNTRFYVTFLASPAKPKKGLSIPYTSPGKKMSILSVSKTEICSVVELVEGCSSIDLMDILEKEFGKKITTRNWNTILKMAP